MHELFIAPFADFAFMRKALAGVLALALGGGPIGVFLLLRRMSLTGDAMAHAILPGAAIGFLLYGLSLGAMTIGGLIAGFGVALMSGLVARATVQSEDGAMAVFYLVSLALGVTIISARGTNVDLMHVFFGSVLALEDATLLLLASIATVTLVALAVIFRPLVVECVDPGYLKAVSGSGGAVHLAFLGLMVLNLVAGFHALGTLLAVGLMMLPAAAARHWTRDISMMMAIAVAVAFMSGLAGLLASYHFALPSGPAIILAAALCYTISILFGSVDGLLLRLLPGRHLGG
jgi:zinc/manganese transport system permease protein